MAHDGALCTEGAMRMNQQQAKRDPKGHMMLQ